MICAAFVVVYVAVWLFTVMVGCVLVVGGLVLDRFTDRAIKYIIGLMGAMMLSGVAAATVFSFDVCSRVCGS